MFPQCRSDSHPMSWSYFQAAEQMLNQATELLLLRDLVRETVFLAFCGEAVCFIFFACPTMTFTTWAALHLNGMYLLCSCAQYPVELQLPADGPAVKVSSSNVGTLIQLWRKRCHGNPCSLTAGQKFVLSPRTTQTAGMCLTAKILVQCVRFSLLCRPQTWVNFKDFWLTGVNSGWVSHSKPAKPWHIALDCIPDAFQQIWWHNKYRTWEGLILAKHESAHVIHWALNFICWLLTADDIKGNEFRICKVHSINLWSKMTLTSRQPFKLIMFL